MVAEHLARQPDARQATSLKGGDLGLRATFGLSFDELDSAGRATGVAPTCVQLIDACVLLESQHEPLVQRNIKRANTFDV